MNHPDPRTAGFLDRRRFLRLAGAMGLASVGTVPGTLTAAEPENPTPGANEPPEPPTASSPKSTMRLPNIPPDQVSAEQQPLFDNCAPASRSISKAS